MSSGNEKDKKKKVLLVYRRTRAYGNFSMETIFDQVVTLINSRDIFGLQKFVSSFYSNGLLPRIRAFLELRRQRADLYHITGDVHFLTLACPGKRTILTIHDCGILADTHGLKRWFLKKFWFDWPVRHARKVTVVSAATRADVLRLTNCSPEKIEVVHSIISTRFRPTPRSFNERAPRILHIGLAPNKNFFRHVRALTGVSCVFVILGHLEPEHLRALEEAKINYENHDRLSDEEMQGLYESIDILLFASTLEGFGMPIIEAQTVGRAVVTSAVSSMPEVAGDGACLVDPYDIASIRTGVQRVITDAVYRETLVQKGLENVRRFEPESVAKQYEIVYWKILN